MSSTNRSPLDKLTLAPLGDTFPVGKLNGDGSDVGLGVLILGVVAVDTGLGATDGGAGMVEFVVGVASGLAQPATIRANRSPRRWQGPLQDLPLELLGRGWNEVLSAV